MTNRVVGANLLRLKKEIAPYTPRIIAVTKYYDANAIIDAYDAGLRDFGESRANDAIKKIESLPEKIRKESFFHFIGHLQTNKVDKVVKYFDYIQSVDSYHLANAISESAEKFGKVQKVLIQVNISGEVQKFGFDVEKLKNCICELKQLPNLDIIGLMCMAPFEADENVLNSVFSKAKNLKDELNKVYGMNLTELSMGMSDDYGCAVENGATMIRIGRLLFN
jgi:pyridoxal phosphate enzyme (YggS family)